MKKSEFEAIAKTVVSNILYLVPEGESIRIYKGSKNCPEFYTVEIGRFQYAHYDGDDIRVTVPEGTEE